MLTSPDRPTADLVTGTRHFVGLDGLRGVAASVVVVSHCLLLLHLPLPRAYPLAVDFFFMLSGFVVAHAYEAKLKSGALSIGRYTTIRLIRLHPLLLLGTAIGFAVQLLLAKLAYVPTGSSGAMLFAAWMGILCLPFGRLPQSDDAFPINSAQWSLFAEYVANLVFAMVVRFLSTPILIAVAVGSFALLVFVALPQQTIFMGWSPGNWPGSLVRIAFPFFAGALIARLHHQRRLPLLVLPWPLLALALIATLSLVRSSLAVQLGALLIVFPAILMLGRAEHFSPLLARSLLYLGALSYPLYILHYPIVHLIGALLAPTSRPLALLTMAVQLGATLAISHLALYAFDIPVRRWLGRHFAARRGTR